MPAQAAGDVEQPVAQPLRLAAGELGVGEEESLRPAEQVVLGDQDELEPGRVGLEVAEGKVAQSALLAAGDAILADSSLPMQLLDASDPRAPCWLVRKTWKRYPFASVKESPYGSQTQPERAPRNSDLQAGR